MKVMDWQPETTKKVKKLWQKMMELEQFGDNENYLSQRGEGHGHSSRRRQ